MSRELAELSRRVANMILPGVIKEIDYQSALVRVESGDLETNWLPYFQRSAGTTIDWTPPSIGEGCLVLSPGGELSSGFVITGVYSGKFPPPSTSENLFLKKFSDGLRLEYDRVAHALAVSGQGELKIKITLEDFDLETKTASIRNESGEALSIIADAFEIAQKSTTPTLAGDRLSTLIAAEYPAIIKKLRSFGGQ